MKGPAREDQELLEENAALKQRIQELEQSESDCRRSEQEKHHSQETAERLAKEMAIIAEIERKILFDSLMVHPDRGAHPGGCRRGGGDGLPPALPPRPGDRCGAP